MTHNLENLTQAMLTNHVVIPLPACDRTKRLTGAAAESRRLGERLIARFKLSDIRMALTLGGHYRYIDHILDLGNGAWAIHLFCADSSTVHALATITGGAIEHDVNGKFGNCDEFLKNRLRRLDKLGRLAGIHPWWDDAVWQAEAPSPVREQCLAN